LCLILHYFVSILFLELFLFLLLFFPLKLLGSGPPIGCRQHTVLTSQHPYFAFEITRHTDKCFEVFQGVKKSINHIASFSPPETSTISTWMFYNFSATFANSFRYRFRTVLWIDIWEQTVMYNNFLEMLGYQIFYQEMVPKLCKAYLLILAAFLSINCFDHLLWINPISFSTNLLVKNLVLLAFLNIFGIECFTSLGDLHSYILLDVTNNLHLLLIHLFSSITLHKQKVRSVFSLLKKVWKDTSEMRK